MSKTHGVALFALIALSGFYWCGANAAVGDGSSPALASRTDESMRHEVGHAIGKGLAWLKGVQNEDGSWSQPEYPALTGLVLTAFMSEPSGEYRRGQHAFIDKGYEYLKRCVQPDGGIYVKELPNYNTAVCAVAFQVAGKPEYEAILRNARTYLAGLQRDTGEKGKQDDPFDGGLGYGSSSPRPDLSNTVLSLEALYYTRHLKQDTGENAQMMKDLDWSALLTFIQRCQHLPEYNDQPWVSSDPANRGGFVYSPGESKAGEEEQQGRTALRAYGSMSYAGLLSYIYADMPPDDPRVTAVLEWLRRNFTLEENPGMGPQGLFYYYQTMAKALALAGVNEFELADGKRINWRKELAMRLINLQSGNGMWANENGRWWEKDPALVTSYSLLALEIIHRGL